MRRDDSPKIWAAASAWATEHSARSANGRITASRRWASAQSAADTVARSGEGGVTGCIVFPPYHGQILQSALVKQPLEKLSSEKLQSASEIPTMTTCDFSEPFTETSF